MRLTVVGRRKNKNRETAPMRCLLLFDLQGTDNNAPAHTHTHAHNAHTHTHTHSTARENMDVVTITHMNTDRGAPGLKKSPFIDWRRFSKIKIEEGSIETLTALTDVQTHTRSNTATCADLFFCFWPSFVQSNTQEDTWKMTLKLEGGGGGSSCEHEADRDGSCLIPLWPSLSGSTGSRRRWESLPRGSALVSAQ